MDVGKGEFWEGRGTKRGEKRSEERSGKNGGLLGETWGHRTLRGRSSRGGRGNIPSKRSEGNLKGGSFLGGEKETMESEGSNCM